MRAIFLNCWFGEAGKPLYDFFEKRSNGTDIFVLLEVTSSMNEELVKIFSEFTGKYIKNFDRFGQAVFARNDIEILGSEKINLYKQKLRDNGSLQKLKLKTNGSTFFVGGAHGKAAPGSKRDTKVRLNQSETILGSFNINAPTIIGGDFNLMPDTESVKMFERAGYRNLIKEFGIASTRNHLSWEQAKEIEEKGGRKYFGIQKFADYVFVSPSVKVKNFEVINVEISDHLPLILDFEV